MQQRSGAVVVKICCPGPGRQWQNFSPLTNPFILDAGCGSGVVSFAETGTENEIIIPPIEQFDELKKEIEGLKKNPVRYRLVFYIFKREK